MRLHLSPLQGFGVRKILYYGGLHHRLLFLRPFGTFLKAQKLTGIGMIRRNGKAGNGKAKIKKQKVKGTESFCCINSKFLIFFGYFSVLGEGYKVELPAGGGNFCVKMQENT